MDFLNLNIPENNIKPAVGKLLIAEPLLNDPNFSRSVILLCEHGEEGSIGFILNHSTELTLGDLLPELYTPTMNVYQGGPVQLDTLHMLHRMPALLGGNLVAQGVYWGGSYDALQHAVANKECKADDMRLFVGYAGWSPGQLEKEMNDHSWIVTDISPSLLFETAPEHVWKQAIKLLGTNYSYLANMPVDPSLN